MCTFASLCRPSHLAESGSKRGSCRIQNRVEKNTMSWYGCVLFSYLYIHIWQNNMCCFSYSSSIVFLADWCILGRCGHHTTFECRVACLETAPFRDHPKMKELSAGWITVNFVTGVNYQVWGYVFMCLYIYKILLVHRICRNSMQTPSFTKSGT